MRRALLIGLLVCLLALPARGAEILPAQAEMAQTGALTDALPAEAGALLEDATPTAPGDFSTRLEGLARAGADAVRLLLPDMLRSMGAALLAVLLCSLVRTAGDGASRVLTAAGTLALLGIFTAGVESAFALGAQTLAQLEGFSVALLAALTAATAATGAVTTAAALQTGTVFFLHLLLRLISELLTPLVYGFLAAGTAGAALGNDTLRRVAELLRGGITACLKTVSTVFVLYLTVTGVVSGSADYAAVKSVKLAVSTAVPVVGSIISDATETVLVSAGLLKNAVGVFGMLGVLAICLTPFVRLGLQYLGLKLTAALGAVIDTAGLTRVLDLLASAMGLLLAMTAVAALLVLFSCVCALRVTGG